MDGNLILAALGLVAAWLVFAGAMWLFGKATGTWDSSGD
jgi:hypothetical protein